MLAMTQTAMLYPLEGTQGGQPAYGTAGTALRCRVCAAEARGTSARGYAREGEAKLIAVPAPVRPGDRLELSDGRRLTVRRVAEIRGLGRPHHLEIEAAWSP